MPYKLATYKHDPSRFPLSSTCPASTFAWASPRSTPLKYTRRPLPFPPCDTVPSLPSALLVPDRDNPRDPFDRPRFTSFRFRSSTIRRAKNLADKRRDRARSCTPPRGGDLEGTGDRNERIQVEDGWKGETKGDKWRTRGHVDSFNPRGSPRSESPSPHPIRISLLSRFSIGTYRFLLYTLAGGYTTVSGIYGRFYGK